MIVEHVRVFGRQSFTSLTFFEHFLQFQFMPWFLYETIRPHGQPTALFEFKQRAEDQPLDHHPETGEPVRRLYMRAKLELNPSNGTQNIESTLESK